MNVNTKTKLYLISIISGLKILTITIILSYLSTIAFYTSNKNIIVGILLVIILIVIAIPLAFREYLKLQEKMLEKIRQE
jgi:magnesium-transporting ATPase (P-type)